MAAHLGLRPWEFGRYKVREFLAAYESVNEREQWAWKRARIQAFYSWYPHVKNGHTVKITDFIPFEFDQTMEITEEDRKQKEELYKIMEKWDKQ
jgi:hypothetical protein